MRLWKGSLNCNKSKSLLETLKHIHTFWKEGRIGLLEAITVPPKSGRSPIGLLVILHGWGANAQDVAAIANYLNLPDYYLAFPNAPFAHPYAPSGKMWYDLPSDFRFQDSPDFENRQDVTTSRHELMDWLNAIADSTNIPLSRTILSGFSQGGAMTLDLGFTQPLAGLMVLSGYLHAPVKVQTTSPPPVLMVHGRQDPVVPLLAAQQAKDSLLAQGVNVDYREFEMGHEIQFEVLEQMQEFSQTILPPHRST
jgi:phospholipase/carboxylesterase